MTLGTSVWADLLWNRLISDGQNLDVWHLRVEKRHHPRKRIGDVVRYEQQPQTLCRKVRGHILPEAVGCEFLFNAPLMPMALSEKTGSSQYSLTMPVTIKPLRSNRPAT